MSLPTNGKNIPRIDQVTPMAAIPGGEFQIRGKDLKGSAINPDIRFGEVVAPVIVGSDSMVIARVPEGASIGELSVGGSPWTCEIGIQIADSLAECGTRNVPVEGRLDTLLAGAGECTLRIQYIQYITHPGFIATQRDFF